MPRPWIGWRRKANILFLRIHSIKIRARVSWTACQAFCVPAKCDADAVKFSLSVLIPTWRRSHWLHIGTWLPYLSMLFFPYISGSFEIVMNFVTFVPMRKFYCATSARFVRSIPVRDVAIRSRHLGIVRALLEGKAHLTPDALHLTADHQSAEMHHSAMWRNGWEGHGRARSMVRSSKVKIVCNTFFRYELIPLCWTGVYVVKFWGFEYHVYQWFEKLVLLETPSTAAWVSHIMATMATMLTMAVEVLRVLIAARAPLDSLRKGDSPFDGMTALQQACIHGSTEAMGSEVWDPKGFLVVAGTWLLLDENRLVLEKLLKCVCLG